VVLGRYGFHRDDVCDNNGRASSPHRFRIGDRTWSVTAPLGDLISPDSASDVEQETKEYWDKRNAPYEPEDMRDRH